ncbi:MAG TPA: hypothetical protein VFT12_09290 [Thermoanaerobaculia bacterium]|nr:hypothetical protein [Thermoanaerobaculia bacterium]
MSDHCLDDAAGATPEPRLLKVSSDPRQSWLEKHAGHAVQTIQPATPGVETVAMRCVDCAVAFAN